jgi:hypothetical protein
MKPVEIEFLMKDKLSGGLDKAGLAVDILAVKSEKAAEAINAKIAEQKRVIEQVSSDLERMESQLQGMKPGSAQEELAADVMACRKVLEEERGALESLEREHAKAETSVRNLRKEYQQVSLEEERAAAGSQTLADKLREQKEVVKQTEADVKSLEKAWQNAAPGKTKVAALDELNAAKRALEEDKNLLAQYQGEQEKTKVTTKRLSMQLRELQDNMARMRLNGQQNTEESRKMAAEAATLSDTLADLNTQTRILSNDDANLQGFMSGVSGLAGVFTTATGALSLFASENEDLARIQTRVQSVMAITMGLQQVFNTLNKDSAFRLVTVVKMKNLLTAANTRLAVSLGISTAAAQALMATLTLGLSVVITGLIVAWDKYTDAQEKAAEKAKERIKIESDGRAQMIKTRFEIDNTIKSLKNFTGNKEQEKSKVEELNRKYGESFGYYDTLAQWYDILIQKSEDYIQMLFLQAKAQSLVNKAVEADEKVATIKGTDEDDVDGSMGWFQKMLLYSAQGESNGQIDAQKLIEQHNKEAKEAAIKSAEEERDAYLEEAAKLQEEAAKIGKDSGIGGHVEPEKPKNDPDAKKKQQEKINEELLALRRKNQEDEINLRKEGTDKKIRQIELDYQREIDAIKKQEKKWADAQDGKLTGEQSIEISTRYTNAESLKDKSISETKEEQLKADFQAMQDYLKEFGTFQQQKLAIAREYDRKISESQNQWGKKSLEKQKESDIAGVDTEAMKQNIDWVTVFGEFGGMFDAMIRPALDEAKKYVQTDKFKNSDQASQKALIDAINQMEKSLGGAGGLNFKKLGQDMKTYQNSLLELDSFKEQESVAITKLQKAQEDYEKAVKNGTDQEQQAAEAALENAQSNADAASENVRTQTDIVNQNQQNLSSTATNLKVNMESVTEGLSKLASGGLRNAYDGLIQTGKAMGGAFEKVAGKIEDVPIVGWIISIIDIFKDGLSNLVGSLLDAIFDAISGILSDVLSGDLFVTIGKSLRDGIGGILNSITFGGWDSWMGKINGSNAKEVNEIVDRLTESNKYLTTAINKLTDKMESSGGAQSTEYYKSAYEKQVQKIENDRQMLEAKMGYHSSHHSNDYYINDAFGLSDWQKASNYVGKKLRSASDLWSLSPEELARLQELPDIWDKINKGKYDQSDWLDAYIDDAETLIALQEQWQDAITDTSFDNIKSGMKDLLKDFETDSKDVIASVDEFMKNAILKSIVDGTYSDELKEWQKTFAEYMSDGILSEEEADILRERYEGIYDKANAKKNEAFEAAGIKDDSTTTQSGKNGSFSAMSQDQGTKLEGMFTSGLNHWVSIDEKVEDVAGRMAMAENHLAKIEEHTGECRKSLSVIAEDISTIKRDGLRMRS